MRSSGSTYRKLLEIIENLYKATTVTDLHQAVASGVSEIIGCDTVELVLCRTRSLENDLYLTKEATFTDEERLFGLARAGQHPIVKAMEMGASGLLRVSDCSSAREWRASALFHDGGYRRQGLISEVAVELPGVTKAGIASFSVARGSPDFFDDELDLLRAIYPHIDRAWSQVETANREIRPDFLRSLFPALSLRESEILFWIVEGKQNTEIALILDRSLNTIQEHVENIIRKLGMENRHQMTVAVLRACLR